MDLDVSVVKNGRVIATERVANPGNGDLTATIERVLADARKKQGGTLWPAQIDVREV